MGCSVCRDVDGKSRFGKFKVQTLGRNMQLDKLWRHIQSTGHLARCMRSGVEVIPEPKVGNVPATGLAVNADPETAPKAVSEAAVVVAPEAALEAAPKAAPEAAPEATDTSRAEAASAEARLGRATWPLRCVQCGRTHCKRTVDALEHVLMRATRRRCAEAGGRDISPSPPWGLPGSSP